MSLAPLFVVSLVSARASVDSAAWIAASSAVGYTDAELEVDELEAGAFDVLEIGSDGGGGTPPNNSAPPPAPAPAPPTRRPPRKTQRARPPIPAARPMISADRPSISRPPDSPPPTSPNRHSRITAAKPAIFRTRRVPIASTSSDGRPRRRTDNAQVVMSRHP